MFLHFHFIATQNYFARRGAANSAEMWRLLFLVPLPFLCGWDVQTHHQKQMFETFTGSQKKSNTTQRLVLKNMCEKLHAYWISEVTRINYYSLSYYNGSIIEDPFPFYSLPEFFIFKCHLKCRTGPHFHCVSCTSTFMRKDGFLKHLAMCDNKKPKITVVELKSEKNSPTPDLHLTASESGSTDGHKSRIFEDAQKIRRRKANFEQYLFPKMVSFFYFCLVTIFTDLHFCYTETVTVSF